MRPFEAYKMGPELDSTDALVRDTYVHFAVAMFRAQNLETEIVNAMIIARLPEKDHVRGCPSSC